MRGLIAEIGNHHWGCVSKAKKLIKAAKEHGANYVKMQAIDAAHFKGGSMPRRFYHMCDLGEEGYRECVEYADSIGIPIFFSVFGTKYQHFVHNLERPIKIAGEQFKRMTRKSLERMNDKETDVIVSIPRLPDSVLTRRKDIVSNMHLMYVSPYEGKKYIHNIDRLKRVFDRDHVGYSDHCPGVGACKGAIEVFGSRLIEKHFNIFGYQNYEFKPYRDCHHAASPKELEDIAKILERQNHAVPNLSN